MGRYERGVENDMDTYDNTTVT